MNNQTIYYDPLPPQPASLIVLEKDIGIGVVALNGNMRLGRRDGGLPCDIALISGIVSRNHGDFIFSCGDYYYRDNNSLNGTFYNGRKLFPSEAVKLCDGDVLRIDCSNLSDPHAHAVEMVFSTTFIYDGSLMNYPLYGRSEVLIGREVRDGIMLSDFMVSKLHAVLRSDGYRWFIIDNNSTNGVAVNNELVSGNRLLNMFDVIRIANSTLIFTGDAIIYNNVTPEMYNQASVGYYGRHSIMSVNIESVTVPNKMLLRNIYLDIDSGDFILILGGSGAGKTTFIKALLGEHRANGAIFLEGMDLYRNFKMLKHKIGLVPQFATTRDFDTVYHTIKDAAISKLSGEYSRKEILARVDDTIHRMNLDQMRNNMIKTLSGGQRKRVEVAIQAIGDQTIFILDEPDSGMDYASRVDLMSNLKSCTTNGGVVAVISHSPDDAAQMFTKVIVLAKSRMDEIGHLAYYGDVPNALSFFGVNKLSDIVMEINYEGSGKGRADEFIEKFEMTRRG